MTTRINYQISAMAAGMCISFVSMLINSSDSYHVEVDSPTHTLFAIKKVFCIPDSKLSISIVKKLTSNVFWELSDVGKFTSPYIQPEFLNIYDNLVPVNLKRNKPFIALAMYQDYEHLQAYDNSDYNWPNNRYRSLDEYSLIFKLIKESGYEVISLDNHAIPFDEKIRLLNDHVECVIGYEGGLCHIAHVLQIPCIVLPWNIPETFLNLHALHLDLKTWFVYKFEDVLKWDKIYLQTLINSLQQNQGNNIFASGNIKFKKDFSEYVLETTTREYSMLPGYRQFEIDFFQKHIEYQQFFGKSIAFYN